MSPNLFAELTVEMKTFGISGVSSAPNEYEHMALYKLKAVRRNGSVNRWTNMQSYLSIRIINDNSKQMSVKQIPFYITFKGKIPDNLGHKTQHPLSSSWEFIFKTSTNFNTLLQPPTPQFYTNKNLFRFITFKS